MSGFEIITEKDVDLMDRYIDDITKKAQKRKMTLIEPYEDEIRKVTKIIIDFIKEHKRKIYGGFALNMLIIAKNPNDAIYTVDDVPDIDFYSPEPLKDLVTLCNRIYKAGFKRVSGREALHKETYSIRVNTHLYCDISYVPRNIYNRMPFKEIDGLYVIGPEFMMIDYFRMITDMLVSSWRLDKTIKRFYKLQKYYPLPHLNSDIKISTADPYVRKLLDSIQDFLKSRNNTCITVGFYAYDQFLKASGILNAKQTAQTKKFKYLEVPYYEIITTHYKKDGIDLINLLKNLDQTNNIHVTEHYPFFQFWGYFSMIYYKDILIAKIFTNNKRCIPYLTVPADSFRNKTVIPATDNSKIDIGTFSQVLLYALITVIKARVDQDNNERTLYYTLISHLIEMRNYYLMTSGKTIYDEGLFQDFTIDCKGIPITPEHERQLIVEYRKKRNKKYTFTYDPAEEEKVELTYIFANSSGNPINNFRNLKLVPEAKDEMVGEEEETEEESTNIKIEKKTPDQAKVTNDQKTSSNI